MLVMEKGNFQTWIDKWWQHIHISQLGIYILSKMQFTLSLAQQDRAMEQMLVAFVFVLLITITKTELASGPLLYLMEPGDNAFPQFCVQQSSLITLTEGKFVFLFPFQRPKTKLLRSVDVWQHQ